jgi:hypothetical protein
MQSENKYYPTLHIPDAPEDLDLPKSGKLLVCFKRQSETITEKSRSYSLEITCIEGVEVGEVEKKKTPSEDFDERVRKHKGEED